MVKEVRDREFSKEIESGVTLVDFWAPWCGPCKMMGPVIDELASEIGSKVNFCKVNVDDNPVVSNQFRIASIPTIMVFKDGKPVDTIVGFRPKDQLKSVIAKHV
jgi:thioredoxin 1